MIADIQGQPNQFKVCGFIQVFLDLVVIIQIVYYGRINKDEVVETASNKSENQGEKKTTAEDKGEEIQ